MHVPRVTADHDETREVSCLFETSNISQHVEESVDGPLVLDDTITQAEIDLKVCCWIQDAKCLEVWVINWQKVIFLLLVWIYYIKVAIFELDLIIIKKDLFPQIIWLGQLLIEKQVINRL